MFAGRIGQKVVMCDRPVLAIDGEQVVSAFDDVDSATGYILRSGSGTTTIFRHNGHDWAELEPADV